jgi:hypothetical protein
MTNSHNRRPNNNNNSSSSSSSGSNDRYFNNHSPQQSGKRHNSFGRGQKSPSSNYFFKSISASPTATTSAIPIVSSSPKQFGGFGASGPVSGSPPNFSHFAGSKCYDAPAPTALPKPPSHWTVAPSISCASAAARDNRDDFSHNLKMILNVQA